MKRPGMLAVLLAVVLVAGCSAPVDTPEPTAVTTTTQKTAAEWCDAVWTDREVGWAAGPLMLTIATALEKGKQTDIYTGVDEPIDELFGVSVKDEPAYQLPDSELVYDTFRWYRQTVYIRGETSTQDIQVAKSGLAELYRQCGMLIDLPEPSPEEGTERWLHEIHLVQQAPGHETTTPQDSSQCETDFQEAAAVPLDQTNDHILARSLNSCSEVAEWKDLMRKYPMVLGVTSTTDAEIDLSFEVLCANYGQGTALCP